MRNQSFHKYLELEERKSHRIKDCTVVIDAQSYFYHMYQKSGLQYVYGCESDKYARYLEKELEIFKKANIKCYFLFKGCNSPNNYKIHFYKLEEFHPGLNDNKVVEPVFAKDIHKQVLKKMEIRFTNCEFEVCKEAIAFARKLKCPIIGGNHVTYCLSGIEYIFVDSLSFDNENNALKCDLIPLNNLLQKYNLTLEKLAIFMVITDDSRYKCDKKIYFPLFHQPKMPMIPYLRNVCLLKWLGRITVDEALNNIYRYVSKKVFKEEFEKVMSYMNNEIVPGNASRYLENDFEITEADPQWLEKGVVAGYIIPQYVQLLHYGAFFAACTIEDYTANNSVLLSIKIISYVYNLLTNYKKQEYIFVDRNNNKHTISLTKQNGNVSKPYDAVESPFENGWEQAKNLRLFEHFLEESLQGFNHAALQNAPEDARLLIIALVYFSRQKRVDTTNIVCSVLLSYIMLGIVFENILGTVDNSSMLDENDQVVENASITRKDCILANDALKAYFELTPTEGAAIFNAKLLHPLVEFQHVLLHINLLNKLCGVPFMPTEYAKTYNGTFAYKFLFKAEFLETPCGLDLVKERLSSASTVLSFFNSLFDIYQKISTH